MSAQLNKNVLPEAREQGYVLLLVMVLMSLSLFLIASALDISTSTGHAVESSKTRTTSYYDSETSLASAINWLRSQSTGMALTFSRNNFYNTFDRTNPTTGSNDTGTFKIPTKIKMQGTQNSAILTFGTTGSTASFPTATDSVTGANFAPQTSFNAAALGKNAVKITLVDAIAVDSTKDYGDTDSGNATPQTDFNPVYRVDSMTSTTQGTHLFGWVVGSLVYDYGVGFYGKNLLLLNQNCDSYVSNSGAYSNASKRANCTVGSNTNIEIQQSNTVYGTARTNGTITTTNPYGGKICSDFASGCPNAGVTCSGSTCSVAGLPSYSTWATYCPTNQGNLTVSANSTLLVAGNAANQKCWDKITINPGKTLTLKTTNYSYFIDTFDIANNAVINFSPNPATGTINLYVKKFVGDKFNGNQVFNINNKPYQLRIHYLGTDDLTLNGNAAMSSFLVAPYAAVTVSGNFTYSGGIKALSLSATGSGAMHYDESGDITTISDVAYTAKNSTQRYR